MLARVGLALALLLGSTFPAGADDGKPAPRYTNDDLDRVHPLSAQTGVASTPAAMSSPLAPGDSRSPTPARGESYWRREAERLQDRLAPLLERAEALRARMAERRQRPGVRPYTDPQLLSWQAQLERLQARMRALEERLQDRARREGALPGWLR
ncbi:MAG TPA: hypothetical protein VF310_04300 [Vicinamibacteria bacterium]